MHKLILSTLALVTTGLLCFVGYHQLSLPAINDEKSPGGCTAALQEFEHRLTQALEPALYPLAEQQIRQLHKGPAITGMQVRFIAPEANGTFRMLMAVTTSQHDYLYNLFYRWEGSWWKLVHSSVDQ